MLKLPSILCGLILLVGGIVSKSVWLVVPGLLLLGLGLFFLEWDFDFGSTGPRWRVGHEGRHSVYYEEFHDGTWRRLTVSGEVLAGRPHHVIYFGPRAAWGAQPEWARERRDEILERIKRILPIPEYDYDGEGVFDARDRELLIEAAGGLSAEGCAWAGCTERALKGKRLCVTHLHPNAW